MLGLLVADARADVPTGAQTLEKARAAWARRSLGAAETLYREAIENGGLAPNEVLEGYVRLGSARAALGKKESAVAAFRAASILDASFDVPNEAGAAGAHLAARAKKDTAKIGSIRLSLTAPREVRAGTSFKVTATLDPAHVPVVSRMGLFAKDGTTGKETTLDAQSDALVEFEIGPDIALPGASIVVHVDALDPQMNRLASAEERVRVRDEAGVASASGRPVGEGALARGYATRGEGSDVRRGGHFWASPWPYVIGGAAMIGAGAAVYFGTRPAEHVSIGQVRVRAQ